MAEAQARERESKSEGKPGGFNEDDMKRMDKVRADQKKKDDETEKKAKEDREREREAAVEHGSILDEEMAKRLDEQDEKEKEYNEKLAEQNRQSRTDHRQSEQAGAADDREAHAKAHAAKK